MKKILFIAIVIFFAACGSQDEVKVKQGKLAALRADMADIQNQISALEKEIEKSQIESGENVYKIPVIVKDLKYETFNHYIEVNGQVEAMKTAYISPEVGGQIKAIYVKEGQRVKEGQKLAKLNTEVVERNIEEVETNLNLARIVYEKQKRLWEQNIGSEMDYLTAKNKKESLENRRESLRAQLDLFNIKAPFDGIVDDIIQKIGELGVPGMQIMNLVNLKYLNINADIAESYLPMVHKGDMVDIQFPSFSELNTTVPIFRIGNTIHPMNRTVNLQLKIENTKEELKPNAMSVIKINDFSTDKALVVPSIIVKQDMKGSFLYVVRKEGNTLVSIKRYVKTGVFYKDQIMINEGLNVGDEVIVEGFNQVSDGSAITVK